MYMYNFASTRELVRLFSIRLPNAINPCLRLVVSPAACRIWSACCPSCKRSPLLAGRLSLQRIVDVVLLGKEVSLDLCVLEELKVTLCSACVSLRSVMADILRRPCIAATSPKFDLFSFCAHPSSLRNSERPTSQMSTLLQVVDPLPPVALAHLVPHQPRHHAPHPLLPDDSILRALERSVVLVVDTVKGWRNLGLFGKEEFGLWRRHCGGGECVRGWRSCICFPRTPSSSLETCDGAIGGVARCRGRDRW